MIQFNFHKRTGLTPSSGARKDRYGPWMYVFSLRLWWSLLSVSFDLRGQAKHILLGKDKNYLDLLFKKDSFETRAWMKKKLLVKSNID